MTPSKFCTHSVTAESYHRGRKRHSHHQTLPTQAPGPLPLWAISAAMCHWIQNAHCRSTTTQQECLLPVHCVQEKGTQIRNSTHGNSASPKSKSDDSIHPYWHGFCWPIFAEDGPHQKASHHKGISLCFCVHGIQSHPFGSCFRRNNSSIPSLSSKIHF